MPIESGEGNIGADEYRTAFEAAPSSIIVLNANGKITMANSRSEEVLGLESSELTGSTHDDLAFELRNTDGNVLDEQSMPFSRIKASEQRIADQRVSVRTPEGRRYFSISGEPVFEDGEFDGAVISFQDVGDQFETETEFSKQQGNLETVVEHLPVTLFALDSDGTFTTTRGSALEKLGFKPGEAVGTTVDVIYADYPEVIDAAERALNGEAVQTKGERGEDVFEMWFRPVTEDGTVEQVMGLSVDITGRKERERRLKELQGRLDLAVDGAGIGTWDWNIETDEVVFNDQWAEMLGYSREELDFHFDIWEQLVHPVDLEQATTALETHIGERTDFYNQEIRMQTKAGNWKWIQTIGRVVERDADENAVRAAGIHIDIDDRKQTEFDLRESERQFEAVFNDPQALVGVLNTDGAIRRVNETALELASTDEKSLTGMPFAETPFWNHDPELQTELQEWLDQVADGEYVEFEAQHKPSAKREIDVKGVIRPVTDTDGEVVSIVASARDITERKKQERQLKALNEATQQLSLATTPDEVAKHIVEIAGDVLDQPVTALWRYDEETETLVPWTASNEAAELMGQAGSSEIGSIVADSMEAEAFDDGQPRLVEDYQSRTGVSHPETSLGSLLIMPVGEYGLLNVGSTEGGAFGETDLSLLSILASNAEAAMQQAKREKALETYKNQLEQSNEDLQEFAYIASHDLQEPLRSVTSYLNLIESEFGDKLDEDGQYYIERAESNASRMSAMIDALLQYSRVKSQGSEFVTVEATETVADTLESLGVLIEETEAKIEHESLPTVTADTDQLRQLFQNLIKNAIEHGGDPPQVEIHGEDIGHAWQFSVGDNGPGIPEAQQDRIFEIFQQATDDGDDSGESGIGLAICERIVSRHQGDIWVESDDDGSTFNFTIDKDIK